MKCKLAKLERLDVEQNQKIRDLKAELSEAKAELCDVKGFNAKLSASVTRLEGKDCYLTLGNFWISFWESTTLLASMNECTERCFQSSMLSPLFFISLKFSCVVSHLLAGLVEEALHNPVNNWLSHNGFSFDAEILNSTDQLLRPNRNLAAHSFLKDDVTWWVGEQRYDHHCGVVLKDLYHRFYGEPWVEAISAAKEQRRELREEQERSRELQLRQEVQRQVQEDSYNSCNSNSHSNFC